MVSYLSFFDDPALLFNTNPLHILYDSRKRWKGLSGYTSLNGSKLCVFDSPESCFRVAFRLYDRVFKSVPDLSFAHFLSNYFSFGKDPCCLHFINRKCGIASFFRIGDIDILLYRDILYYSFCYFKNSSPFSKSFILTLLHN